MIGAAQTRYTEFLAFEIVDIFDARMGDQVIDTLLESNQNNFQGEPRQDAAHRTDERAGERDVAVYQRHHTEPRIGLDNFSVYPFLAKEALADRDIIGCRRVAATGGRNAQLLRLRLDRAVERSQTD
jgi:hypothetical protein